jgi:hypothetical protein
MQAWEARDPTLTRPIARSRAWPGWNAKPRPPKHCSPSGRQPTTTDDLGVSGRGWAPTVPVSGVWEIAVVLLGTSCVG